ncbi:hypothetical protein HKD37_15G043521 [Glycine soja]
MFSTCFYTSFLSHDFLSFCIDSLYTYSYSHLPLHTRHLFAEIAYQITQVPQEFDTLFLPFYTTCTIRCTCRKPNKFLASLPRNFFLFEKLDLEIEATLRRNKAERRRKLLQDITVVPSVVRLMKQANVFPLKKTLKKFIIWEINSNKGFLQGPYNQQGQWRTHPGNQFNKDQSGPSNKPIQQGLNIFQRTTKLEDTLTQFMQVTMSNHKSTESALKNLEVQVGQLAKQIADKSSNSFVANTEQNPKEECKAVMTRSKRFLEAEDEDSVVHKTKITDKKGTDGMKNEVRGESNQEKEEQIMVKNKELKDQEKEKESKSEKVVDEGVEVPYPMIPSKKEKYRHLVRFLDNFRKLEITLPFGEALQQMPFYLILERYFNKEA